MVSLRSSATGNRRVTDHRVTMDSICISSQVAEPVCGPAVMAMGVIAARLLELVEMSAIAAGWSETTVNGHAGGGERPTGAGP